MPTYLTIRLIQLVTSSIRFDPFVWQDFTNRQLLQLTTTITMPVLAETLRRFIHITWLTLRIRYVGQLLCICVCVCVCMCLA